jgi:hypothetical protein
MYDDTPRDTLLTDMFVLGIVCQELRQTNYVISGDGLYSQCVRACVCLCGRALARQILFLANTMYFVKHHVSQTPDVNCIILSKIGETV